MSNQAKDWQEGTYTVVVGGKNVAVSKKVKTGTNSYGFSTFKSVTEVARCAPEDEFSLSMGVALAMDRLSKKLDEGIKVGDKVKIKDRGLSYTTYVNWIAKNVGDVKLAACYAYDSIPSEGDTEYVVKAIAPWGSKDSPKLAYVQRYFVFHNGNVSDSKSCYLIDVRGLKKV